MEERLPKDVGDEERANLHLCIFPHLPHFLAIDLRGDKPKVSLLKVDDVFTDSFFHSVEEEFSSALREKAQFPLTHFMGLSMRVEEIVREAGLSAVINALTPNGESEPPPRTAVLFFTSTLLSFPTNQIIDTLTSMLGDGMDSMQLQTTAKLMENLMAQERRALGKITKQELLQSIEEESPNFLTIWENKS